MYTFVFTKVALKDFQSLPVDIHSRIKKKLQDLKTVSDVKYFMKPLTDLYPATHRLRVGDYRMLVSLDKNQVIVYKIGHRREIYE